MRIAKVLAFPAMLALALDTVGALALPAATAASPWTITVRAPAVHALKALHVTGSVTSADGDPARPNQVVIERRTGHAWHALQVVALVWTEQKASFTYDLTETSRPGTYVLRATVTPAPGMAVSARVSVPVVAAIDLVVSGPLHRSDVPFTYHSGCPVSPAHLRRIDMTYWSFEKGQVARGTMIVRDRAVGAVRRAFTRMFAAHFPIHRMVPVDAYHGKDIRSMAADNTSAFNCRHVTGSSTRRSEHSYGDAIDINPWENPYVGTRHVYPSKHFLRRRPYRQGMVVRGGVVDRAFAAQGWKWGGRWSRPDYQHFSANGA